MEAGNGAPQQQTVVTKTGPGATAPAPAAPAAPAADPLAEAKKFRDEAQSKLDAAEKVRRVHAAETRKFADEKKGIGQKLSDYEGLKKYKAEQERLESQAKLNKAAYLEAKFGKDWYDQIVQERMNGGAPTADTVALEVSRVEERFKSELEKRDQAAREQQVQAQKQQMQAELTRFGAQASEFARANLKEYPIFESLGNEAAIGQALVTRIRAEHDRTVVRDDSGAVVAPGKVMSFKEAADAVEAELFSIAERAVSADKYRAKLTEKLKPATVAPVGGVPQLRRTEEERRTLSNGLTATTPGQKRTFRNDDERRAAAFAAVEALKGRQA